MKSAHLIIFCVLFIILDTRLIPVANSNNFKANSNKNYTSKSIKPPWILEFLKKSKENKLKTKCSKCLCGIVNANSKIVGGVETKEHQYPWMAMLLYGGEFFCGGSLINDHYVLTAAHCVNRLSKYGISVRLLAYNRLNSGDNAIDIQAENIITHSSYYFNDDTYINDIALIKLEKKVDFSNKKLKPICLPCGTLNLVNEKGIVIGWGRTSEDGEVADKLLQVSVHILSNKECESKITPIVSDMLCAGEESGGKDACQGDSGGPLHIMRRNKYYQAGVVSFGDGCARPNTPGIYSKLTSFYRWIKENTKDSCYCK